MKLESRRGMIVIQLAQQLRLLDVFFPAFAQNERIWEFICEYKEAIYLELSYRLQHGKKDADFGSYEYLLEQAERYVRANKSDNLISLQEKGVQKAITQFKGLHKIHSSVSTILEVYKKHGTEWIPLEFRRSAALSLFSLPIMVSIYEAMRVALIASMVHKNTERFTNIILGYYAILSVVSFIQEQKTLKHPNTLVFNPYVNLAVLGLSNQMASILVRAPKHALELSATVGALLTRGADASILSPVLGALLAASVWGTAEVSFNFAQEKIQKRKKNKGV